MVSVDEIYKTLKNDYNGSILDKASQDIKETFRDIVSNVKDSGDGNTTLIKIIDNYFNGVLPTPEYISGPMSLSYYTSSEYDMKIYIFGEIHGIEGQCRELYQDKTNYLDITEYLHKVFLNSDKFIDFYLEDPLFRTINPDIKNTFLSRLRHDFIECLNPNTRSECIYKTVRTHFVDARSKQKGKFIIATNPFGKFLYILKKNIPYKETPYTEYLKKLLELNTYDDIASFIIETAINIPIIKKELKKCYLDRELVISIFRKIISFLYKSRKINIDRLHIVMSLFYDGHKLDKYDNDFLSDSLISIEAPIVDIYTICRMFKIFKKTDNLPDKPRYIIYYAGKSHSQLVRFFITQLKFSNKLLLEDKSSNSRCLYIDGIKLDFK